MTDGKSRRGTSGYGENAQALTRQYESVSFEDAHADVLALLPRPPAKALDIGAGTGRDAAALARRGFAVTAVEPTPQFRAIGQELHKDAGIIWIDDALPDLATLPADASFDLIMLSAVWMHLDTGERARAMPRVAGLLRSGAVMFLSLRHGPVPEGRIMFDVSADETAALALQCGLQEIHRHERPSQFGQKDVWWSRLAFRRPT
jgi:SAM-dependent methyltransferase